MDFADLQRHWDAFGRIDPLWAILTDPNRRGNRWDPVEFFATGREEIAAHLAHAASLGVPGRRRRALDFGCGAGRLTQALAAHFDEAIGVDVAPSMIDLARRHNAHGDRCSYLVNEQPDLSRFPDATFDILYTGRVLQHMEPRYAESYVREFVRVLAPGGYLSFDLPSERGFFPVDGAPSSEAPAAYRAALRIETCPSEMPPGGTARVAIEAVNEAPHEWRRGELNVGNHWARIDGSIAVRDDGRIAVALPWGPGQSRRVELTVTAPADPGRYRLQLDIVEESVTWFADAGSRLVEKEVIVGAGPLPPPPEPRDADLAEEPTMEMHAVRRERVEATLADTGATLIGVRRVYHCGPTWLAFRYDVTKA